MNFCEKTNKPINFSYATNLTVDRLNDIDYPLVCVELDDVLFKVIKPCEITGFPSLWLKKSIDLKYVKDGTEESRMLIERPGAAELLVELNKHASFMIYSSLPEAFIEEAMLKLSIAQGDPDTCTDEELRKGEAYYNNYVWSRDQCIEDIEGYKKSLGILSECSDHEINDIWLIDHKPEFVDFPNHVIPVSEFDGNPNDRDLYRLIDKLFIN